MQEEKSLMEKIGVAIAALEIGLWFAVSIFAPIAILKLCIGCLFG